MTLSIEELQRMRSTYYELQYEKVLAVLDELIAIREQQGKAVGWVKASANEALSWDSVDPIYLAGSNPPVGWRSDYKPVFTAPQKPIVHPDTVRMDWLVSQNVEVRTPMAYGSHARFVAQCDSDDCEEYHTTLREQVDAAIEAAALKPEGE